MPIIKIENNEQRVMSRFLFSNIFQTNTETNHNNPIDGKYHHLSAKVPIVTKNVFDIKPKGIKNKITGAFNLKFLFLKKINTTPRKRTKPVIKLGLKISGTGIWLNE